jgi:hypothetical protein
MGFYDAFFGSDQSLYTAYSIIAAIIAICLTILLTATDIPIGNRILMVLFVIITLIPSIFLTLFQLTCIVTGGTEPNRWWCHAFAWILAAFIIIYCVVVVIVSLVSLFNYNKAIYTVNSDEKKYKITENESENYAKEIIQADEIHNNNLELFKNYNERFVASSSGIDIPDIINAAKERDSKNNGIEDRQGQEMNASSQEQPPSSQEMSQGSSQEMSQGSSQDNLTAGFANYSRGTERFQNMSLQEQPQEAPNVVPSRQQELSQTKKPQEVPKPVSQTNQIPNPSSSSLMGTSTDDLNKNKLSFADFNSNSNDNNIIDDKYAAYLH